MHGICHVPNLWKDMKSVEIEREQSRESEESLRLKGDKSQFFWKAFRFSKYNVEKSQISQSIWRSRWTIKPESWRVKNQISNLIPATQPHLETFKLSVVMKDCKQESSPISVDASNIQEEVHKQDNLFQHFRLSIPLLPGK